MKQQMKQQCFLLMSVLIMCSIARAATINFDFWPDGNPITAPTDPPFLSITDEFAVWGIIFESTTKIHQHSTPADLPTPPNALISDHFEDSITLDAHFVDPENPTIDGTVTWVEFTQDRGAQSGGGTFIAYDINGNKVIEQSFNTSGHTFHWEYAGGIHRIYIGSCYDSLDDLTFGEVIPEPEPIEAAVDIHPNTLNLQSKGKWITCYIWLPEEYDVADIDSTSIVLEDEIEAE